MNCKTYDLNHVPPFVTVGTQEEIHNLQAFFYTYDPNMLLILARKQRVKDSVRVMNSYFMANDDKGCINPIAAEARIRQQADTYLAINYRYHQDKPVRKISSIISIGRFVVDIDNINHRPMDEEEAERIAEAMKGYSLNNIECTSVVYTGRGVQIHFAIQPEKHVFNYRSVYDRLSARLADSVYRYLTVDHSFILSRPDPMGINGLCRLPGSFNTISYTYVKVMYVNEKHLNPENRPALQDIMSAFKVKEPAARGEKKGRKAKEKPASLRDKVPTVYSEKLFDRAFDSYMKLAIAGEIHVGNRNMNIYAFSYNSYTHLGLSKEAIQKVRKAAHDINNVLFEPLDENEMNIILYHAEIYAEEKQRGHSLMSQFSWTGVDASILGSDAFRMSEEERRAAKKKSARRFSQAKKTARRTAKHNVMAKVYDAWKSVRNIKAVARLFSMSRNTVRKYIRIWAEELKARHDEWMENIKVIQEPDEENIKSLLHTVEAEGYMTA